MRDNKKHLKLQISQITELCRGRFETGLSRLVQSCRLNRNVLAQTTSLNQREKSEEVDSNSGLQPPDSCFLPLASYFLKNKELSLKIFPYRIGLFLQFVQERL